MQRALIVEKLKEAAKNKYISRDWGGGGGGGGL